ncbi:tetratricopeptide repeat protein [Portibacter lacus]|uniref:Tetratricopeptide repeat protein n=1 Tax=Portibacter lacus TaxID=1099794 RepID=A0AA37WIK3_9BACT|nr:hypothetical protein [Portibacter lacus]GLR19800.1 hypothetical protein GCM10007940_44160 [Portibacter lacus]
MKQDEIFAEGKEFSDAFLESAKIIGRSQLKSRFRNLDKVRRLKKRNILGVAATIAILIAASIFMFRPSSEQQLYSAYYHKMPNKVVSITRGVSETDDLKLAFLAYEKSNYLDAKEQFLTLENTSPEVKLYLGIIAMEEYNYDEALNILLPLSDDSNYHFKTDAKWYAALCYLKTGELEKSKNYLLEIQNGDSTYKVRATELLAKL